MAILRDGRSRPHTRIDKAAKDFLTDVDLASESALQRALAASTPEIGFYGEEGGGAALEVGKVWVADPLDGTINYATGSPLCGVTLARPRAAGEDVENQLRAVDDLAADLSSIWRSCAGVSSLSKMTMSTLSSEAETASVLILPAPRNVDGSGFGPLLQHAQHDLRAGGLRQAGELVERPLGVEPPGAAGDQADQRRALGSSYRAGRSA